MTWNTGRRLCGGGYAAKALDGVPEATIPACSGGFLIHLWPKPISDEGTPRNMPSGERLKTFDLAPIGVLLASVSCVG